MMNLNMISRGLYDCWNHKMENGGMFTGYMLQWDCLAMHVKGIY